MYLHIMTDHFDKYRYLLGCGNFPKFVTQRGNLSRDMAKSTNDVVPHHINQHDSQV